MKTTEFFFKQQHPIKYRIYLIKRWFRVLFCKHNYKMTFYNHPPRLLHCELDENRNWKNKIWGNYQDITVRCTKCGQHVLKKERACRKVDIPGTTRNYDGVKMIKKDGLHYYELDHYGEGIKEGTET